MSSVLDKIQAPIKLTEASPEIIKAVQNAIGAKVDGICGVETILKFNAFKKAHSLGEPDYLGATTAKKLLEMLSSGVPILKISPVGLKLICDFEGCRLEAYKCPANVLTIGYGHTKGVKPGMKITKIQAEEFLRQDLAEFESAIASLVKVPLNQNQFDSLVSFTYNCGIEALRSSTLLKLLNAKDYKGAANQFLRWNKAGGKVMPGLTRRRTAEKKLFELI
ncbi:MAG: lysozyme [Chroococcidiopsis sp.]